MIYSLCSCVHEWVGENEICTRWPRRRAGRWGPCHSCPRGGAGGKRGGQPSSPAPSFSRSDVWAVCWHRRQAASLPGGDRLPGSAGGVRLRSSCLQAEEDNIIQVRVHTLDICRCLIFDLNLDTQLCGFVTKNSKSVVKVSLVQDVCGVIFKCVPGNIKNTHWHRCSVSLLVNKRGFLSFVF